MPGNVAEAVAVVPVQWLVVMRHDMLFGGGQCLAHTGHVALHERPVRRKYFVSPPPEQKRVRRVEQSAQHRIDYVIGNGKHPASLIEPARRVLGGPPGTCITPPSDTNAAPVSLRMN